MTLSVGQVAPTIKQIMTNPTVTPLNQANNNSYFFAESTASYKFTPRLIPFAASVAIGAGSAVMWQISNTASTGNATKATSAVNTGGANLVGFLLEPIATTDSDYATAGKLKAVLIPESVGASVECKVGNGTVSATDIGSTITLYDETSVDLSTLGYFGTVTDVNTASGRVIVRLNLPNTEI